MPQFSCSDAHYGGMVLVAGFAEPLPDYPELDGFVAGVGALHGLRAAVGRRVVIASRDDEVVPHAMTRRLASQLGAAFFTVEQGGHFLACEGFTAFPLVHEQLAAMMRAPAAPQPTLRPRRSSEARTPRP